jgi:hypothetical protein
LFLTFLTHSRFIPSFLSSSPYQSRRAATDAADDAVAAAAAAPDDAVLAAAAAAAAATAALASEAAKKYDRYEHTYPKITALLQKHGLDARSTRKVSVRLFFHFFS